MKKRKKKAAAIMGQVMGDKEEKVWRGLREKNMVV